MKRVIKKVALFLATATLALLVGAFISNGSGKGLSFKLVNSAEAKHKHSFSAATCTEPQKCSCGAIQGSPTGHHYLDATCTQPSTCRDCKKTMGSAKGHQMVAATCQSPAHCTRCSYSCGSKTGHDFCVFQSRTEPTCQVKGKEVYKCRNCSQTKTTTLNCVAHNYVYYNATTEKCQWCSSKRASNNAVSNVIKSDVKDFALDNATGGAYGKVNTAINLVGDGADLIDGVKNKDNVGLIRTIGNIVGDLTGGLFGESMRGFGDFTADVVSKGIQYNEQFNIK